MTDFRPGRFQILPPIVKNLIIINSLIVFAQFVLGKFHIDLSDYLGLHYWGSHYFKPWQLVTHMFMHGSFDDLNGTIMHLFSNMFALWMFGSILENVWGPKRFITFYLICGLGAAMLHLGVVGYEFHVLENAFVHYQQNPTADQFDLFITQHYRGGANPQIVSELASVRKDWINNPSANLKNESIQAINHYLYGFTNGAEGWHLKGVFDEATVGASGAVFGILFAFGYLFPNTLLYLYFLVPIKAKYVVGAYALFELYAGFRNSAGDNVAHFAHLGGMLVAFILLKIWNSQNRKKFY
ncbi:MAG: rhomboid family intramembrane serine protease [Sphingobacteriales bacterium]|nr:MAG: rhomboid family intramembrane serine protease [Sphingobacteriales bacterium]